MTNPTLPPTWLMVLWGISLIVAITTEVIRYEKNQKKTKTEVTSEQTKDVGLSDTYHKGS
tara:strand:- start:523 stop:702 length:180 start_codon:yes stop_codon:yes gene_type:complete